MDKPAGGDPRIIVWFFLSFYVMVVLRNAWVGDDAYITMRVVDNFINGYGLCWNIAERVQAFTHPLWLLVITPFYALTKEAYFTLIGISVLLSTTAVAVFSFRLSRTVAIACLGIAVLSLSDAFIDYSTSGLESPLTYLLLAIFMTIFFTFKRDLFRFVLLVFIASMAVLARPDIILLYLPILAHAFWEVRGKDAVRGLLIGLSPLILWELFSLLYYGFPFPNPAYAKLQTGIPFGPRAKQGVCYLINSITIDPLTMTTILVAVSISVIKRRARLMALSLGIILTLIYTVYIGGCFMSGRFFAAPFLASVCALAYVLRNLDTRYVLCGGTIIIALGFVSPYSPIYSTAGDGMPYETRYLNNFIVDERAWYNASSGLSNYQRMKDIWPSIEWAYSGIRARESGDSVLVHGSIGHLGFRAGPDVYIIDRHGLADPLLGRLPIGQDDFFKPGHFVRRIPVGYIRSIESGQNVLRNPRIAEYYDIIKVITRGPILNLERLKYIFNMNCGRYDHLIEDYAEPHMQRLFLSDLSAPKAPGTYWNHPENTIVDSMGIEIDLGEIHRAARFEFCRDHNDDYLVKFYLDERMIDIVFIPQYPTPEGGLSISTVSVPKAAVDAGYNKIDIFPAGPDHLNSIGHLIFESGSPPSSP